MLESAKSFKVIHIESFKQSTSIYIVRTDRRGGDKSKRVILLLLYVLILMTEGINMSLRMEEVISNLTI